MTTLTLDNGLHLQLVQSGERFLGIGDVHHGETALRSGRRPWFAAIRTPEGVEVSDYSLLRTEQTTEGVRLHLCCRTLASGPMEWMVHEVRPRWNTADWADDPQPAPDMRLELMLRPITRIIGGRCFSGFSYSFHYHSERHPLYKLLDRGTWEPGGRAVGNEFWMRNCFVPSRVLFASADQFHSTEWYLPDCQNPSALQFLPLQTELQGFTFTASSDGTLVTWTPEVTHLRSLFEKKRGLDEIEHWHEHCGDLTTDFSTSPFEVLFTPGDLSERERFNLYEEMRELVHETLHAEIGMRRERITTFGMIEEWGPADLQKYRREGLPRLLEAGIKTVYLANHFENNMNTYGVSNFCCTVDYKVAESVGEDNLRDFCHSARQGGAKVQMWANTALSSLTPILAKRGDDSDPDAGRIRFLPQSGSVMEALQHAPAAFVRNPSNAIEADHYSPQFCALNLRDEAVRSYWLQQWGKAGADIGLGGIFLDSSFNLSSDKFHWIQNTGSAVAGATPDQTHLLGSYRPASGPSGQILSQYRAHLDLMVQMQQLGYGYCNEDLGVFGTHRHGPAAAARLDTLPLWTDCIAEFNARAIAAAGADPADVFFQGLAYRMMWCLHWNPELDVLSFRDKGEPHDRPTAWQLQLLEAFNHLSPLMFHRELIGDADNGVAGVLYRATSGQAYVFWSFSNHELPLPTGTSVCEVLGGETIKGSSLACLPHRIYSWTSCQVPVRLQIEKNECVAACVC